MGDSIYGTAAAQFWLQKTATNLTKSEAAAIAAILPNPRKHLDTPPSHYISKRKQWILQQMRNYGSFSLSDKTSKK